MAVGTQKGTIFVAGEFRATGETAPVLEKATGEPLAQAGVASVEDLEAAVAAAVEAQPKWAATTFDERAAVLRRAAAALEAGADEVADLIVRETGSIAGKAQYEVGGAANELYEALIDAVEESIVNALLAAETMTGHRGNTAYALEPDVLVEALKS